MQRKLLCWRSRSGGKLKQPGRASDGRKTHLEGVGWTDEAVGGEGEVVSGKILIFVCFVFFSGGIQTHQRAAGRQAGRVCLTTGSESSPPPV